MLLLNTEENILGNTADLRHRVNLLKEVKELNEKVSGVDEAYLTNVKTQNGESKLAAVSTYKENDDYVCLLRALDIALHHVSAKNLFVLSTGERAYSRAASASGCFVLASGFFHNRGVEKQKERLMQIDTAVFQLEGKYLFKKKP